MPSGNATQSLVLFTPHLLFYSLADNYIGLWGNMEGLNALIAAIKELPNLSSLKCASGERKSVVSGKCGDRDGRRIIKKKNAKRVLAW